MAPNSDKPGASARGVVALSFSVEDGRHHKKPNIDAVSLFNNFTHANVLYHSLFELACLQMALGGFFRSGEHSLVWIAATKCPQSHSETLRRLRGVILRIA